MTMTGSTDLYVLSVYIIKCIILNFKYGIFHIAILSSAKCLKENYQKS